jgi:hypothetical protein
MRDYNPLTVVVSSIAISLIGCSGHDDKYIPYELTSFEVYLYDDTKAPKADYFAGRVMCVYSGRDEGVRKAQSLAYNVATREGFATNHPLYYVICCMTKKGCSTKIR